MDPTIQDPILSQTETQMESAQGHVSPLGHVSLSGQSPAQEHPHHKDHSAAQTKGDSLKGDSLFPQVQATGMDSLFPQVQVTGMDAPLVFYSNTTLTHIQGTAKASEEKAMEKANEVHITSPCLVSI